MADGSESNRKGPAAAVLWPSLFVVFAAILAYLTYRPPLETARPEIPAEPYEPGPRTVSDIGAVHARLWEDPLEAAYRDRKKRDQSVPPLEEGRFRKIVQDSRNKGNGQLLFMPVLLPGSPSAEDKETRMRTRYAVLAALATCRYKLALGTRMSYMNVPVKTHFGVLGDKRIPVLGDTVDRPITIPVKLYREDVVKQAPGNEPNGASGKTDDQECFGGVLVCWLNGEQLGDRPLAVILQVFHHLFPADDRAGIRIAILGPTSSDTLLGMLKEDDKWVWPGFYFGEFPPDTRLFSPRATVWPGVLKWPDERDATEKNGEFRFRNCGIGQFVRAIGTDQELFWALRGELKARGAWPEETGARDPAAEEGPKRHVVLITERDTLYGRAYPELFPEDPEVLADERVPRKNLHVFTYLRGVDGSLPAEKTPGEQAPQGRPQAAPDEPPEGQAQLDYLRRLERQLVRLAEELRYEGRGEITAIGVVGSDFYDKLLVLRALRRRFPRAWFFTTDLDAGFNDPEEYRYTRNLIVASHFGLELHPDLQRWVPPFRDSYQTSTFFATLLALEDPEACGPLKHPAGLVPLAKEAEIDPWGVNDPSHDPGDPRYLQPLVFEIGRRGPYQLTMPGEEAEPAGGQQSSEEVEAAPSLSAKIHPVSPRQRPWLFYGNRLTWLLLGGLGILCCVAFNHTLTRRIISAAFGALRRTVVLVLWLLQGHRSPWLFGKVHRCALKAGSRRLRRISGSLVRGVSRLAERVRPPSGFREWFAVLVFLGTVVGTALLVGCIVADHTAPEGEPFSLFEAVSVWPSALLRFLAVVLAIAFFYDGMNHLKRNSGETWKNLLGLPPGELPTGWKTPPRFKWKFLASRQQLAGWWKKAADWWRGMAVCGWTGQPSAVSVRDLYAEYASRGHPGYRLLRIGGMTACYMLFGFSLFFMTDFPNNPARGGASRLVGVVVLMVAVVVMVALVFFALDATQLCRQFLHKLVHHDLGWEDTPGVKGLCQKSALSHPEDAADLLMIRVIAHRTNVVVKLMYYPCFIIFLVMLSRHPLLDYWNWPWPLVLLMTLNFAAAVFCAFVLRVDAAKARQEVLGRLRARLSHAVGKPDKTRAEHLRMVIGEIDRESRGAFSSWANNPVLRALAWPAVGGFGGLLLIEQFLAFLRW